MEDCFRRIPDHEASESGTRHRANNEQVRLQLTELLWDNFLSIAFKEVQLWLRVFGRYVSERLAEFLHEPVERVLARRPLFFHEGLQLARWDFGFSC